MILPKTASAALLLLIASAASAAAPASFAYRMVMTPEEGPLDPAVEARYTPAFAACQDKAQITAENAACYTEEFARQDKALNRVWAAVFPRIETARRPALRLAQRRWIAARDPFCRAQSDDFSGGTIAPVIYAACRAEQTIRRTMWLEALR